MMRNAFEVRAAYRILPCLLSALLYISDPSGVYVVLEDVVPETGSHAACHGRGGFGDDGRILQIVEVECVLFIAEHRMVLSIAAEVLLPILL